MGKWREGGCAKSRKGHKTRSTQSTISTESDRTHATQSTQRKTKKPKANAKSEPGVTPTPKEISVAQLESMTKANGLKGITNN